MKELFFNFIMYRMKEHTLIVTISLCVVLLAALIGSLNTQFLLSPDSEHFTNNVTTYDSNVDGPVRSDRILYFKIGLANFFTTHDKLFMMTMPDFKSYINDKVYIWPNYQDLCCKTMDNRDSSLDCACDDINIHISSCTDDSPGTSNEPRAQTIEEVIGAMKKSNCTMTMFGNEYLLLKKSLVIRLSSPISLVGVGNNKLYRLSLSGSITSFVLSRPLLISFNTSGLYQVVHEDINNPTRANESEQKIHSNTFAFYDSTRVNDNIVYLRKINHDIVPGFSVYTPTSTNIYNTFKPGTTDMTATLYHLSYKAEVKLYDAITNTVNLVINQDIFMSAFKVNNVLELVTDIDDTSIPRTISIRKEFDGILHFMIDGVVYSLPEGFVYYDPSQYERFDIIYTYAYDILLITCLGVESSTRKNVCYVLRHELNKKFQMKKSTMLDIFKNQMPEMHEYMTRLRDVMNVTCIPNFAQVAYKLGYVFTVV